MDSRSLFTAALGLEDPWYVKDILFDPKVGRIDFEIGFKKGARFACAECGTDGQPVHDTREREWRHLNFFQFQAYIHAKVPRVRCEACGKVTQVSVPWARPGSGFTQLMEALVVTLAQGLTVSEVARLLRVSDARIWRTLDHYVDTARAKEDFSQVQSLGLDETASRRGHHYISLFHDLQAGRLLFACEGRKAKVVDAFCEDLEAHGGCAENVQDVCIDMSASFASGLDAHLPSSAVAIPGSRTSISGPVSRSSSSTNCARCASRPIGPI